MNETRIRIFENTKKTFFNIFPICIFFYLTLSKSFPKSGYSIEKNNIKLKIESKCKKIERTQHNKLRNKIGRDLKMHYISVNWNKINVTKLVLNREGKIMGSKFYKIFYPNYFTNSQNKSIIIKSNFFKKKTKTFLNYYSI